MPERLEKQRNVDPTADIISSLYLCDPDVGTQMSVDQLGGILSRLEAPDRKTMVRDLGRPVEELQEARVNLENLGQDSRPLIDALDRQIALAQARVQSQTALDANKISRRDLLGGVGILLLCGTATVTGLGGPVASAVLWNEDSQKVSQRVAGTANDIVSNSCVNNPQQDFCQVITPLDQITRLDQIDKNSRITGLRKAELAKAAQKIEPLFRKEVFDENTGSFRSLVRDSGYWPAIFMLEAGFILGLGALFGHQDKGSKKS